jgi:glycosyltransferase involved in cell wall biosynthesis
VKELATQASAANVPFEIICIDDASSLYKEENQPVRELPHATYMELTENAGRSRIRNLLVSKAKYEMLLFLDCDSKIAKSDYIKKYLEEFRQYDILSGGTLYESCPPTNPNYALHWTFGSRREPKPDGIQRKTFTSNNFVIKKSIIEKYPFNEQIVRYGHEDSFFQMELEKQGLTIRFIQNPVIHIGLETNKRFIEKTQESVMNLYDLYASGVFNSLNTDRIRLLKTYIRLKKWKADRLFARLFPVINRLNQKTNASGNPNLLIFDCYKLTFLARIARTKTLH